MGDRSNVVLILEDKIEKRWQRFAPEGKSVPQSGKVGRQASPALWLYSHWGGEGFRDVSSAVALKASKSRWSDPSYMGRIFIDSMFVNCRDQEYGGGVSFGPADNDGYAYRVIHLPSRMTWLTDEDCEAIPGTMRSFEDFIASPAEKAE